MVSSVASSYIICIVIFVAILLIFGIPRILSRVSLPGDFAWTELDELRLSPGAQSLFKKADQIASQLFFMPVKIFTVPGMPQKNEHKLYYNDAEAAGLLVTVMHTPQRVVAVLEFATRFEDGTELDTGNAPVSGLFVEPPWKDVARFPGQADLNKLYGSHRARVEQKKATGIAPRYARPESLMDEIRQAQVRQMDYQVEKGILKKDEKANVYRATPKIAFKGVSKFINPFADDFTLKKFLVGAALGLALTCLWVFLVDYLGLEAKIREIFPAYSASQITFLAFCPGFILAGLALGWQFPQKGFLWGFIISIPGIFLLPASAADPLVYSLLSAMAGYSANKLHGPEPMSQKLARLVGALVFLGILIIAYFLRVK